MDRNVGTFQDTAYILAFADTTINMWLIVIFMLQFQKEWHDSTLSPVTSINPPRFYEPRIFFLDATPPFETRRLIVVTVQRSQINWYTASTRTNLAEALRTELWRPHCLTTVKVLCDRTSPPRLPYFFLRESWPTEQVSRELRNSRRCDLQSAPRVDVLWEQCSRLSFTIY